MSTKLQFRRGTTAEAQAFVGAESELYVDIEARQLILHDGVTPGGKVIGDGSDMQWLSQEIDEKMGIIDGMHLATVGTGGDFETINDAIHELSRYRMVYSPEGLVAELRLLSGFKMKEQVYVKGIDLGWITITGEDETTTIDSSYITKLCGDSTLAAGAFTAVDFGILPIIGQTFWFKPDNGKSTGIAVHNQSRGSVLPTYGFLNAGYCGLYANAGSTITAPSVKISQTQVGVIASGGSNINIPFGTISNITTVGISANGGSVINAYGSIISYTNQMSIVCYNASRIDAGASAITYCGGISLQAESGSTINAISINITHSVGCGIGAFTGATINAHGAQLDDCTGGGVVAAEMGSINCQYAVIKNTKAHAVSAFDTSKINARFAIITNSTGCGAVVGSGGCAINISATTITGCILGEANQAVNILTANGIIYK